MEYVRHLEELHGPGERRLRPPSWCRKSSGSSASSSRGGRVDPSAGGRRATRCRAVCRTWCSSARHEWLGRARCPHCPNLATGSGKSCSEKPPPRRGTSSGWGRSWPPHGRGSETPVSTWGPHRTPSRNAVEDTQELPYLHIDARFFPHLLDRHLGGRIAHIGPAGRIEPDPRIGPRWMSKSSPSSLPTTAPMAILGVDVAGHPTADAGQPGLHLFVPRQVGGTGGPTGRLLRPCRRRWPGSPRSARVRSRCRRSSGQCGRWMPAASLHRTRSSSRRGSLPGDESDDEAIRPTVPNPGGCVQPDHDCRANSNARSISARWSASATFSPAESVT